MDAERYSMRSFRGSDYGPAAALHNAIYPDHPISGESFRRLERAIALPVGPLPRYVVEDRRDRAFVGLGALDRNPFEDDAARPWFYAEVHPEHRGVGIGSHLYATLLADAHRRGATGLRCTVREGRTVEMSFLARRGFVERRRSWMSVLDVGSADTARLPSLVRALAKEGIEFTDLRTEGPGDPRVLRQVHALESETGGDVPRLGAFTPLSFAEFRRLEVDGNEFLPEAWILAKDGPRYVGLTSAAREPAEPKVLRQSYTATLPAYRRRRIAQTLKLLLIEYAKGAGFASITTSNDSLNAPMWNLNARLGFRRTGTRIHTECAFGADGTAGRSA
ncbi:MAG: GNAT family N-acetyltransferase [Thermoplasmata archaeon]